jgi:ABC-type amino acid transport substrate-binding protein
MLDVTLNSPARRLRAGLTARPVLPVLFLAFALLAGCGGGDAGAGSGGARDAAGQGALGHGELRGMVGEESFGEVARGPVPLSGVTLAEARAAGQVMLHFAFVPSSGFAYRDDDGRLTGVTVEILRDFARYVAHTYDLEVAVTWWEEPRWADFYAAVRDSRGGVFGIGNVTITEARAQELDFSPPYLQNIAVLVTHEAIPELSSLDAMASAFAGLVALRYPGTLHEARLVAFRDEGTFPGMTFRPVASNDELVDALAEAPTTFGYIDIYNFWRAREAGRPLRRHPVGDDAAETFGVILPNDSDWTPVLTAFFEGGDGTLGVDGIAGGGGSGSVGAGGRWGQAPGQSLLGSARMRGLLTTHLGAELAGLLTRPSND